MLFAGAMRESWPAIASNAAEVTPPACPLSGKPIGWPEGGISWGVVHDGRSSNTAHVKYLHEEAARQVPSVIPAQPKAIYPIGFAQAGFG